MPTITDPFIVTLIVSDLANALARNRDLARRVEAQERDLIAASVIIKSILDPSVASTIQRLSNEAEQLANDNDRLRELVKDAYAVFVQCGATLPYMDYLTMIGSVRADMEAVIAELETVENSATSRCTKRNEEEYV
jgi:hypothetical protein